MSKDIRDLSLQDIPEVPSDADGMIVRLSRLHRQQILGLADGRKHYISSIARKTGSKLIFVVGLEEAMPSREDSLELKKFGILFGMPVTETDIRALDENRIDCISFEIVNIRKNNKVEFMVEVRRQEELE